MQIYVSIGRLTFRLALGLDEKDPVPSSDTPSPLEDDHPLADETPRVVGFQRSAALVGAG